MFISMLLQGVLTNRCVFIFNNLNEYCTKGDSLYRFCVIKISKIVHFHAQIASLQNYFFNNYQGQN